MPKIERGTEVFQHQADASLSQANPVSATLYAVLVTTKNVRIISLSATITWATTQPTPLETVVTIDGNSIVFIKANPVSATAYGAKTAEDQPENNQPLDTVNSFVPYRAFLLEGRSVKVEVRITWATTQPTPLVCRVKNAKIP